MPLHVHSGPSLEIEIDIATFAEPDHPDSGGVATAVRTRWAPKTAPIILSAEFPPAATIEIVSTEGGRQLVAAIELVSPANKDRPVQRRLFAAKCASYLSRGVGLIVVDVVNSRRANLHDELANLCGWSTGRFAPEVVIMQPRIAPSHALATARLKPGWNR